MNSGIQSGTSFGQAMVDQRPRFDGDVRKRKKNFGANQVQGKNLIRPDRRKKVKYL